MNAKEIQKQLHGFLEQTPLNRIEETEGLRIYEEPLVGIASAKDPLFERLKEEGVIGQHHMSPEEWMTEAVSVVSFFLPFSRRICSANAKQDKIPAFEWVCGRYEGEALNDAARGFIMDRFRAEGHKSLSPMYWMDPFIRGDADYEKLADPRIMAGRLTSNWSERHVAFIAGLGTFSLSKALITKKGCAGRFGSVIVDCYIKPTQRVYSKPDEYCTYCEECIKRCPAGAITPQGKDKDRCDTVSDRNKILFKPRHGCGLCYTRVPCENERP